ncbi:MAG TPA: VOC family protein [Flavobacterium sp.]|nr:VOC family protein [Flavobacterium sp.]
MKIPPQYLPVMPYLVMKDAQAFLAFTKKVFNAKEQMIHYYADDNNKIQHGEIKIYDAVIMFGEANENWGVKPAGMYIHVENVDDVYARAIENGATSLMPPSKQEYGYTAGFEDPSGNHWWIALGEKE